MTSGETVSRTTVRTDDPVLAHMLGIGV